MTQDKMRRVITACVSAATVLLVFLLGFLIYQWIEIGIKNKKIKEIEQEIAVLEQVNGELGEDLEYYKSEFYLQWRLQEMGLIKEK